MTPLLTAAAVMGTALAFGTVGHAARTGVEQRRGTLTRREAARTEEAEAENQRIRTAPHAYLQKVRRFLELRLVPLRLRQSLAEEDHRLALAELTTVPAPTHTGGALVVRYVLAVAFVLLTIVSTTLAVEIFVATNDGILDVSALGKGIGAGLADLMLTLLLTELLQGRERLRTLAGVLKLAVAGALLVLTIGLVATYASARSDQAWGPRIEQDELALVRANAALTEAGDTGSTSAKLAAAAAGAKLAQDRTRLRHAQASDTAQAMLFPAVTAATGPFGVEGAVLATLAARRRRATRRVRVAKRGATIAEVSVQQATAEAEAKAVAALRLAGVLEVPTDQAHSAPGSTAGSFTSEIPAGPVPPPLPGGRSATAEQSRPGDGTPDPWDL